LSAALTGPTEQPDPIGQPETIGRPAHPHPVPGAQAKATPTMIEKRSPHPERSRVPTTYYDK
jgi:hypothetical protein